MTRRFIQTTQQRWGQELGRNFSHSLAIQPEPLAQKREPRPAHTNEISQGFSLGL
jgi:hypothetical protein